MTRINSSIHVTRLTDEHLLAEHREIKRMTYSYLKRKQMSNGFNNLPEKFTLGKGHVLFFVNKGLFTFNRYKSLHEECLNRGFEPSDYATNWECYKSHFNDYSPTQEEHQLLLDRITERLLCSKKEYWHYFGKRIIKQQAIQLLNTGNYERTRN